MRRNIPIAMLAIIVSACAYDVSVLHAQERTTESAREDDKQVLKALLEELRQLRLALQRSNSVSHRLQITVERLRLQQARVDSLTHSLENVRARMTDLKSARPQIEEQIKYAEELVVRGTEQNRRDEVEQHVKEMKARLASWSREENQLREREVALNLELQIEQNKLNELNAQLENMMRQLDAP
jgi:chromosome segregation ATPase